MAPRYDRRMHPQMTCVSCGGSPVKAFEATDDYLRRDGVVFTYSRCPVCGTYALVNRPENLGDYYADDAYYDGTGDASQDHLRRGLLSTFAPWAGGGRMLDIGPGNGALLREARNHGFTDQSAVERDARSCELMRGDGVSVVETADPVAGLDGVEPADAVVMAHVIEHVEEPMELLTAAASKVKPGGVLVVATPNPESLSFKVCRSRWRHVDAPRHLFLLPHAVVADRARRAGLENVRTTTTDPSGLECNRGAWWPWALNVMPTKRSGHNLDRVVRRSAGILERRGLRGSTYTAVFRRPPA